MSKLEKLIKRLLLLPNDFTYNELVKILNSFGYKEERTGKTAGSRVKFINADYPSSSVRLHKPHPSNIMKEYQLKHVIDILIDLELIGDKENEESK